MASKSSLPTPQDVTLQRGKACLPCRRRKMRCDGVRPHCTQCFRGGRADDCEYTDSQGRTRTQLLEENIARLQSRLNELENPASSTPSITLRDPYEATHRGATVVPATNQVDSQYQPGVATNALSWWEYEELPLQISETLVQEFIPYCEQFGFVLNIPRFLASIRLPTLHLSRPHPALLHVIYLWALRMSRAENLMQHESLFLQRAVLALQEALNGGGGATISDGSAVAMKRVHAIQAEVLLAQYFFCLGRLLEGRYHSNAAVSLAIGCGLHRINPMVAPQPNRGYSTGSNKTGLFDLIPARDAIELGERLNVFWAVFNLDRCWSAVTNSPTTLVDSASVGTQIDSPWPLDVEEYERANVTIGSSSISPGSRTIQGFLSGQHSEGSASGNSYAALQVKASALFERASRLATLWNPRSSQDQSQANTQTEMQSLARIITQFARGLVPVNQLETHVQSSEARRILLVVHSLAHGAMIHLHAVRARAAADGDPTASNVTLMHAGEVVRILEIISDDGVEAFNPILGNIWNLAALVFIQERERVSRGPQTQASGSRMEALETNIDRISTAFEQASSFPALAYQVAKTQELLPK